MGSAWRLDDSTRTRLLGPMLFAVALVVDSTDWAQEPAHPADRRIVTEATIVDLASGDLIRDQFLIIEGDRIGEMGSMAAAPSFPAEASISIGGMYVVPGLIDLHTHLLLHPYDESSWNDQVLKESLELRVIRATVQAQRTLEAGFTTIRDLGTEGAGFADVALRDAVAGGLITGPTTIAATRALVTTGGYGPAGFDPRFAVPQGAQVVDGPTEARRATREQIAAGADWIKVYADYRRKPQDAATPTFTMDELTAIVDEARSAGLRVSAHATTDEGIRRAVEAGVATIEHGYSASLQTLRLMKDHRVALCPTLAASEAIAIYSG
jgi:imidazolonepropionase-like amidohydrolase